jgi:hypothetical protein
MHRDWFTQVQLHTSYPLQVSFPDNLITLPLHIAFNSSLDLAGYKYLPFQLDTARGSVSYSFNLPITFVLFYGQDTLNTFKSWGFVSSDRVIFFSHDKQNSFDFNLPTEGDYYILLQGYAKGDVSVSIDTATIKHDSPTYTCIGDCVYPVEKNGYMLITSQSDNATWFGTDDTIDQYQVTISTNTMMYLIQWPLYTIIASLVAAATMYILTAILSWMAYYFNCEDDSQDDAESTQNEETLPLYLPRTEDAPEYSESIPDYSHSDPQVTVDRQRQEEQGQEDGQFVQVHNSTVIDIPDRTLDSEHRQQDELGKSPPPPYDVV